MKSIYLDNAATTSVDKKVIKSMLPYFNLKYGNASSLHLLGEEAKRELESARKYIAKALNAKYREIIFTSSGTEANNTILKGLFWHNYPAKNHIITTKIEHDCILSTCKWLETFGAKITYLNVDAEGFVDLQQLEQAITDKTIVVSVIHGNNEVGTIQDLKAIGDICKRKSTLFHTDACQSFTKVLIDVIKQKIDFVAINAHKIHGPKGIGAFYIKQGIKITPLLHGRGHEFGLRSSTENVPGIIGFAQAVRISNSKSMKKITKLRDRLIEGILRIPNAKFNGAKGEKRLCNNVNISFKNIEGESLGNLLNVRGIFTSTGSACSSNSLKPSHVLRALGLGRLEANSSIRLSLSKFNTEEEVGIVIKEITRAVEKLRKINSIK